MEENDNDVKHVIVLDEGKREEKESTDEAYRLLRDIDEYIAEEEGGKEAPKPVKKPIRIRRRKPVSTGLKKLLIALGLSLVVLTALVIIAAGNLDTGYREPVKIYEKYLNTRDCDGEELSFAYGNGLAGRQFKALRGVQREIPEYNDMLNASRQAFADAYDETCILYGEGRKYTLTVDEAVPLTENELLALTGDYEGIIRDLSGSSYARSSDPDLSAALKELTDKAGEAKITRGYRLYCTQNIRGAKDDGPVSLMEKCEFTVVRLGGCWIMWDKIYDIFRMTF